MYVSLTFDITNEQEVMDALDQALQNPADGLEEAVNEVVMPDLSLLSTTLWNVRTGAYSSSWEETPLDQFSVMVGSVDVEYASPLEFGWTTQAGTFIPGGAILEQSLMDNVQGIAEVLLEWLKAQAGLL